jgi:hypothetical protein
MRSNRRQSFEFGIRNAECGKKKRRQMADVRVYWATAFVVSEKTSKKHHKIPNLYNAL